MTTTAMNAMSAWNDGCRRRRAAGAIDRAADAAIAAGGAILANATMPLEFGLPTGGAGFALAASLILAGFAAIPRRRARRTTRRPAAAMQLRAPAPAAVRAVQRAA